MKRRWMIGWLILLNTVVNAQTKIIHHDHESTFLAADVGWAKVWVNGEFIIRHETQFTNCTFLFTANSKITVAPGNSLTLNTCSLKAGCGAMWDGIYASIAGSEVIINGGTLQDMENGVVISNQGKLNSDGPTFNDNHESIQLVGLPSGYNGKIINSTFLSTSGLLPPYSSTNKPRHGIAIYGSYHVLIGDESDVTQGNLFQGLQNGIYMEYDAGFITAFQQPFVGLYYNRFNEIDGGVGFDTLETIGGASMYEDPEGTAIFGTNKLVKHKIQVDIIGNDASSILNNFDGCGKDVVLNAFNATVLNNHSKNSPGGFLFSQCEGKQIIVRDNVLEDVRLGISNTGNAHAFHCDNNLITLSDENYSYAIMSNQYSKNTGATLLHYNDINLPNLDYSQGVNIVGGTNDNLIGNTIHFTSNSPEPALTAVPTLAGVKVVNSINTFFDNNTIEGLSSTNFLSNRRATGFYLHKCTQAIIDCNIARDMQFGIYVVGDNKTGAYDRVKNNLFSSTTANLLFRHLSNEGSLGDVGFNSFTQSFAFDANNKFYTPTTNPIGLAHLYRLSLASAIANGDKLVTATSNLDHNNTLSSQSNITGHEYAILNPQSFDETYICSPPNVVACNYSSPNPDLPDIREAIEIAMNAQQYLEHPNGGKWLDERLLYEWLNLDTSLTAQYPILDSFYEANNGDVLGSLWEVDNMLSQLADSTQLEAEQDWDELLLATRIANDAFDETLIFAEKAKWINGLFLDYLEYGLDVIDSMLRTEIYTLATQCPYQMGEAVFKARDMVAMLIPGLDYDDMEICNGQGVYKGGLSPYQQENALLNQSTTGLKDSIDYLSVYPNPVRDELSISHLYSTNLKATFRLFDLSSKKCYEKQIEKDLLLIKLQLDEIAPGMYLYEYVIENGVSYRGKLLVE